MGQSFRETAHQNTDMEKFKKGHDAIDWGYSKREEEKKNSLDMGVCEKCKYIASEGPGLECPYLTVWCSKGHWDGPGDPKDKPINDPWKDCVDFKER